MCTKARPRGTIPAVLTAAAGLLLAACSPSSREPSQPALHEALTVTVTAVEAIPLHRSLPVLGTLRPKAEAAVAAQVEGEIDHTHADFGDRATAGEELAQIDSASYEVRVRQAAASLAKAKANALNAEQSLKRVIALQTSKISSASDMDLATAQAEQARAEVKAAEADEAIAQLNLARSHINAPFSGRVAERLADAGDYVKIGTILFRIVNDSELKYVFQVPERYAGEVRHDQVVQFSVDAWPGESFEGRVYLINPAVSTATRGFDVAARVDNAQHRLKANTFARGELILERDVPTPVIPLEAILNFAGIPKVFVIENQTAHSRLVKTGRVKDGRQEILEGLKPGELVAVVGVTRLYENAKVRVRGADTNSVALK